MANIIIEINTDNAAFSDCGEGFELARILRKLADYVEDSGDDYMPLHDINGNKCGTYSRDDSE